MTSTAGNRNLTIIFAVIFLGLVATVVYTMATPHPTENFTEFYILDPEGAGAGYPRNLRPGESVNPLVGIINRENQTMDYALELRLNGRSQRTLEGISLPHDGKWEQRVTFRMTERGDNQSLEFILYRAGETAPYRGPLVLKVNVP